MDLAGWPDRRHRCADHHGITAGCRGEVSRSANRQPADHCRGLGSPPEYPASGDLPRFPTRYQRLSRPRIHHAVGTAGRPPAVIRVVLVTTEAQQQRSAAALSLPEQVQFPGDVGTGSAPALGYPFAVGDRASLSGVFGVGVSASRSGPTGLQSQPCPGPFLAQYRGGQKVLPPATQGVASAVGVEPIPCMSGGIRDRTAPPLAATTRPTARTCGRLSDWPRTRKPAAAAIAGPRLIRTAKVEVGIRRSARISRCRARPTTTLPPPRRGQS